jgi:ParB-like nuclease domain
LVNAVATPKDIEFIVEVVKISSLRLDARYQRDVREADVERIARDYRPELFQPIVVGMRDDGALHIVDGQHRVAAARHMEWVEVPCMIFESRGFEHEAEVFERLQTARTILSVPQRWKARLARKEPIAVGATKVVEACGLRLSAELSPTSLSCYTAVERAYERGNLRDTLLLIIQSWEYDVTGFRSTFIDAVSQFLNALQAEKVDVDMARVRESMAKLRPSQFLRETSIVGNKNAAFMRRVIDSYNTGLRTKRVDIDDPIALLKRVGGITSVKKMGDNGAANLAKANAAKAKMTPEERSAQTRAAAIAGAASRSATAQRLALAEAGRQQQLHAARR